jgi:ribosome-binding factor A
MKNTRRQRQLGELIQRELANILLRHPEQPLFMKTTIVEVRVAPDMSVAKVYVSAFQGTNVHEVLAALKKSTGFLRHGLAQKLNLRITPQLYFVYDESIERGIKLSALIDEAVARDQELHQNEEK